MVRVRAVSAKQQQKNRSEGENELVRVRLMRGWRVRDVSLRRVLRSMRDGRLRRDLRFRTLR